MTGIPERKISLFVQAVGLIFFGALVYLSWLFYKERMLCFDNALFVFRLVQSGHFIQSNGRYGDYLSEILPLLALKSGCSLKTIVILYSINFVLLNYAIFLLVTLVLKNNGAGIAIMLACCLAYHLSFYLSTELHEELTLGVLLWAILHPEYPYTSSKQKYIATVGALITIVVMSLFHPLGIFLIAFVLGMEMICGKKFTDKTLWLIAILGVGWCILKFCFISKQGYDGDQIISLHAMFEHIRNWKNWGSTNYVKGLVNLHFRSFKWLAIICLVFSLRKGILAFLFFSLYILGFTFIFLANYQAGTSVMVYENYYIVYGFFITLIFIFAFYAPQRRTIILILVLPFLWMGVNKIYSAHIPFTYRIAYLNRIINQAHLAGEKKSIINSKCYPSDYAWTSWDIAFETMMYSSLAGPDSTVTIFIKTPEFDSLCYKNKDKQNILLGPYFAPFWFTSNSIPQQYCRLPSTGYSYLNHSQDDTIFHESAFSNNNVSIIPVINIVRAGVNDEFTVIPIEFTNSSGHIIPAIPSGQNPVCLLYNLYDDKGKPIKKNIEEPLELDIGPKTLEGLIAYYPRTKGVYYARVDLITQGKTEWNITTKPIEIVVN